MLRSTTLILAGTLASGALAQPAIFSNGSAANPTDPGLSTGGASDSGVSAPPGAVWSEVQRDAAGSNAVAGFACHLNGLTGSYRFADDFVVPAGTGWSVRGVSLFAYQTAALLAPFDAVTLRIWNGAPGSPGSAVVWGDTTTNRLSSITPTNTYRIFNSIATPVPAAPGTTRRIWELACNVDVLLQPGAYWLDWQIDSVNPDSEAFAPPVTRRGVRAVAAWNGRQLRPSFEVGVWQQIFDTGKPFAAADLPQDLPFIVRGGLGCIADVDDGSGSGTPDGGVDISDLLYYVTVFNDGVIAADCDDGTNTGTPDGGVDINDLLYFLIRFDAGC